MSNYKNKLENDDKIKVLDGLQILNELKLRENVKKRKKSTIIQNYIVWVWKEKNKKFIFN